MALSKRTRFEIFKRDGFACHYCGRTPPQVKLEVDHIVPKSAGGSDDRINLITACFDCNRGKSDGLLSNVPESLAARLEDEVERAEQLDGYDRLLKSRRRKRTAAERECLRYFKTILGCEIGPPGRRSIGMFLNRLAKSEILDAIDATGCQNDKCSFSDADRLWRYFCGVCWTKIRRHEEGL